MLFKHTIGSLSKRESKLIVEVIIGIIGILGIGLSQIKASQMKTVSHEKLMYLQSMYIQTFDSVKLHPEQAPNGKLVVNGLGVLL